VARTLQKADAHAARAEPRPVSAAAVRDERRMRRQSGFGSVCRVGGTMSSEYNGVALVAAVQTQVRVSGSAPMIPGAFEVRVNPRSSPRGGRAVDAASQPAAPNDRERVEREREGGGAPSQRRGRRLGTIGWRLWRSLLHPTALPHIWRYRHSEHA